jgi:hypothetical protein
MAKDVFAFSLTIKEIPAGKDKFADQVVADLRRFFPTSKIEELAIQLESDEQRSKRESYQFDAYLPEYHAVVQSIRVKNPNKVIATALAFDGLAAQKPEIHQRIVIFDGAPPSNFEKLLKERATGVIQRGNLQSEDETIAFQQHLAAALVS